MINVVGNQVGTCMGVAGTALARVHMRSDAKTHDIMLAFHLLSIINLIDLL
jgi:hypothetical protein